MSVVNFGIVGTGHMASSMMPAFHQVNGAQVAAVCSTSKQRADKFAADNKIAVSYGELEAMLSDKNIDAVYIANATSEHASTAISALNADKHVLCEKPFARTTEEGERVIAAAHRCGKLFMEGLWTHFLPAYARVYSVVHAEKLGKAVHFTTDFAYPATQQQAPRLFTTDGGGVLLDRAVYPISFALKLLGPIKELNSDVIRDKNGVDVHVNIQTRHKNGVTAQLAASLIAMMSNSASIACKEGLVSIPAPVLGAETVRIEQFAPAGANAGGGIKAALKKNPFLRRIKSLLAAAAEHHPYGADPYLPQMQHFVHLIASGKTESDIVAHNLSLDVLRVIDRIRAGEQS